MRNVILLAIIAAAITGGTAFAIPPEVSAVNPEDHISVRTAPEVAAARQDIVNTIWGPAGIDTNLLPAVTVYDYQSPYHATPNLDYLSLYDIPLPYGGKAGAVAYFPKTWRTPRSAFIIHGGHEQNSAVIEVDLIKQLIEAGFMVMSVNMPLAPANPNPLVLDTPQGRLNLSKHEFFSFLDTDDFNPLRMFLDPAIALVNYAQTYGVEFIGMTGVSGGGWTALLAGAADDRIDATYSVDAIFPTYARGWDSPVSYGDYEQSLPGLTGRVSYLDLSIIAGQNRHIAYYVTNDTCCYNGDIPDHWRDVVSLYAGNVGGYYTSLYDTTTTIHEISAWTRNNIINDFTTNVAP
jgi:hypothetical protein